MAPPPARSDRIPFPACGGRSGWGEPAGAAPVGSAPPIRPPPQAGAGRRLDRPVQTAAAGKPSTLGIRIASALVMGPAAIAAVWFGPPWFPALVVAAGAVMAWEWARLCAAGRIGADGWLAITVVALAALLASFRLWTPALGCAVLGAALVLVAGRMARHPAAGLRALGPLWFGIPCVALLWVGADPATGWRTIFWIFAVVWATDIGAYAVGRSDRGTRSSRRGQPLQDLGRPARRGDKRRNFSGLAAAASREARRDASFPGERRACHGRAVRRSCGIGRETEIRREGLERPYPGPWRSPRPPRRPARRRARPVALLNLLGGSSVVTWR